MKKNFIKRTAWILCLCLLTCLFYTGDDTTVNAEPNTETKNSGGYLITYTRNSDSRTSSWYERVTNSVHLAYSTDGLNFTSLNYNTGVLFAKTDYAENPSQIAGVIKTLTEPYLFRMADGTFGLLAVRTNELGGTDSANRGKALFYTSKDLIDFQEQGFITLNSNNTPVRTPLCQYNSKDGLYNIYWKDSNNNIFVNTTADFQEITAPSSSDHWPEDDSLNYSITDDSYNSGAKVDGNIFSKIAVTEEELDTVIKKYAKLKNTGIEPLTAETFAGNSIRYNRLPNAVATYSDGSSADYDVVWNRDDYNKINFNTPGVYTIRGTIEQMNYSNFKIDNFADPVAVYSEDSGKYYFMGTTGSDGNKTLYIRESDTLDGLTKAAAKPIKGDNGYSYELGVNTGNTRCLLWAPELHKIGDYWYCLFASSGESWDRQRAYMMRNTTGDLGNPDDWEDAQLVKKNDGRDLYDKGLSIDMTYFEANGEHFVVWAQRETIAMGGNGNGNSDLWIASIDSERPYVVTSEPIMLSQAEYGWEKRTTDVIEGPFTIQKGNKIYLTFSGSGVDETYCVGYLEADITNDLLNVNSWKKSAYPILTWDNSGEKGPGHSAFTIDEYGNEIFIYHFFGNSYAARSARTRRLHWAADDTPVLNMSYEDELSALNGNLNVELKITVKRRATGLSLNKTEVTLSKGQTETLTPTVTPSDASNKKVRWKSSDPSVASVSDTGVITALKKGTTTIIAIAEDGGYMTSCKVTVLIPASGITISSKTKKVNVGKKLSLNSNLQPSDTTDTITWKSSNTKKATVNQKGVVTGKGAGSVTIYATAGNQKAQIKLTVKAPVTKVNMKKKKVTLKKGKSLKLSYTTTPKKTTDKLKWTSSNKKIVSVKNGKIRAKKVGTAKITLKATSGKYATCRVTVKN